MSKSFVQQVEEILTAKGVKPIPTSELVENKTYNTIGLDAMCFPCLCTTIFVCDKGGKAVMQSNGIRYIIDYEYEKLYPQTEYITLAITEACEQVFANWQKAVREQLESKKCG